ncbi:MAG TPA: hypothetical protein VN081_03710 [Dongiaceae bacterium]|nr:hypothetical protein [Dongiaceae bacterium]
MHIDHATTVAVSLPAMMASTSSVSTMLRQAEHIHVERASFPRYSAPMRSSLPKVQPARDDLRKYVQSKKVAFISGGQDYVWPSV